MNWFGFIWIGILIIAYIIWTVKCVWDFIDDVKWLGWSDLFTWCSSDSWKWWLVIHLLILFVSSIVYFFNYLK